MISISSRYSRSMCIVIAPALLVVVAHSYVGLQADDCPGAAQLTRDDTLPRRGEWMRSMFDAFSWREETLESNEADTRLRFAIVRSYDPKKLYHHPEGALFKESAAVARGVEWLPVDGESIPVHRAYFSDRDRSLFVAYVLVSGSRPVANPYLAHLQSFPAQLLTGRRPMTLLFVSGTGPQSSLGTLEKRGLEWLANSWKQYRMACGC